MPTVDIEEFGYDPIADAVFVTVTLVNDTTEFQEFDLQINVVNGIEQTDDLEFNLGAGGQTTETFEFNVSGATGTTVLATVNVLEPFVDSIQEEIDITEDSGDVASVSIVSTSYDAASETITAEVQMSNGSPTAALFELDANVINGIEATDSHSETVGEGQTSTTTMEFDVSGHTGDDVLLTVNVLEPFPDAVQATVPTDDDNGTIDPPDDPDPDPGEITLQGCVLPNTTLEPGERFNPEATVTNGTDGLAVVEVGFFIDGELLDTRGESIRAGESETVTGLIDAPTTEGTYSVTAELLD